MPKIVGLVLMIVGFIVLAGPLFFKATTEKIISPVIGNLNILFVSIAGLILVIVGVFLFQGFNSKKVKQEKEEVPIYKGTKIVGYRKEEK